MPRGAFWTIIVDDQPTAFRAPVREDLLPTLKQLHRQHPTAVIKWFQRGRLWETPGDAMDASKPPRRGEGWRPGGQHKDPRAQYKVPRDVKRARWAAQAADGRGPWVKGDKPYNAERRTPGAPKPRGDGGPNAGGRPAWKPKGDRPSTAERRTPGPPKPRGDGGSNAERRPAWKPQGDRPATAERRTPGPPKPRGDGGSNAGGRPAWKPKGDRPGNVEGRPRAGAPRPDWRGDRAGRDATPRSGGAAPPPAKRARTWRAGQLPPPDRKKKTDD